VCRPEISTSGSPIRRIVDEPSWETSRSDGAPPVADTDETSIR
jgi:hypothetical protein